MAGIAHDDLKRQHEDFVGVTKAANGKLSFHIRGTVRNLVCGAGLAITL